MDWAKYKKNSAFFGNDEYMEEHYDELKDKILNFDGIFPENLICDLYHVFPELRKSKYSREQALRGIEHRHMSEVGIDIGGLWWDENLDFLIEHPEFTKLYEPVNIYISEDEDYYLPVEELVEVRKKELGLI